MNCVNLVFSVDLVRYLGLKEVEFYYVQMKAGDCVYIPYKWLVLRDLYVLCVS